MSGLALIAGMGGLPALVAAELAAEGRAPLVCAPEGFPPTDLAVGVAFRFERLVPFLRHLVERGVEEVVFAGGMHRPRLDPALFDPETAALLPRVLPALGQGDDALLRAVIGLFEEAGLQVAGLAEVAPGLVPGAGVLGAVAPGQRDEADAARAAEIVAALGALDIGQGAVVAQGLCLGLEALPGTDAMLAAVAAMPPERRPDPSRGRGVAYKAPKPGQDRRVDLPAVGPATVERAAAAGLAGIAFEAGGIVLLDRAATVGAADAAGLFLWAREP